MADRYSGSTGNAPVADETGLDPKYVGKTQVELANMLKETESKIGQREQEYGELKKRMASIEEENKRIQYEARMKEYYAQQELEKARVNSQQTQDTQKTEPVNEEDYDISKPVSSTIKIVRQTIQQDFAEKEKAAQQKENAQRGEFAKRQFEQGFARAVKANPEIFSGVEQEVQAAMFDSYKKGRISPDDLGSEDMWVLLARNAKWYKGEDVPAPRKVNRSQEMETDSGYARATSTGAVPTQVKETAGEKTYGDIKFNEKSYEMMRILNISEDEAKKRIIAEREGRVS